MTQEEFEALVDRFSEGTTSKEEDLALLQMLSGSAELLETFLNEIKVAKLTQELTNK